MIKRTVSFLIFVSSLFPLAISQTKWIAHRSHSGTNSAFSLDGPDNFGWFEKLPPPRDTFEVEIKPNGDWKVLKGKYDLEIFKANHLATRPIPPFPDPVPGPDPYKGPKSNKKKLRGKEKESEEGMKGVGLSPSLPGAEAYAPEAASRIIEGPDSSGLPVQNSIIFLIGLLTFPAVVFMLGTAFFRNKSEA